MAIEEQKTVVKTTTNPSGSEFARRIVVLVFGLIQAVILLRIVFLLLDARESNGLVVSRFEHQPDLRRPVRGSAAYERTDVGRLLLRHRGGRRAHRLDHPGVPDHRRDRHLPPPAGVRMKIFRVFGLAAVLTVLVAGTTLAAQAPVGLGTAASFAVLAGTTITNTGPDDDHR